MKIKLIIAIILGLVAVAVIRDYQARMVVYNQHVCEVYGKQEDCITPLPTNTPTATPEPPKPTLTPTPSVLSATNTEGLVNAYRASQQLPPIKHDQRLCEFAQKRSIEARDNWSHTGFHAGADPVRLATHYRILGENLGRDWDTQEDLITAWSKSPTHNQNMLTDWSGMCLVCTNNVCSNIFGR